ncbi:hypothetical protein GCM10025877_21010 [Agromyces mangrovi Wang et al. 2018]|nr:hypothetical protein GCM10025877_21010 [Agromyces mangrovi]
MVDCHFRAPDSARIPDRKTLMRRTALLAPLALATLLLAGCTGAADTQTTEEACGVLNQAADELATGMGIEDAFAEASADPIEGAERLGAIAEALATTAQDEIGNADVRDAALEFSTQVGAVADVMAEAASDPESVDLDAFTTTLEDFQAASVAYEEICPA